MNKDRRKAIAAALELVDQAKAAVEAAREAVEVIQGEEEEYRDNMHENLQGGEKYARADEVAGYLSDAEQELGGFDFDSILSNLEAAAE